MPEGFFVRRALSAVPRRRRCQVCRSRMTARTYGPHSARSPMRSNRYLDGIPEPLTYHRLRWVRYLCADCAERNNAARADVFRTLDRRLAATVRRYASWLDAAPRLRGPGKKRSPQLARYYEAWEIAAAADDIARSLRRRERGWLGMDEELPRHGTLRLNEDHPLTPFSPDQAPDSYADIVTKHVLDENGSVILTGSVFRAAGERVVVHWHSEHIVSPG